MKKSCGLTLIEVLIALAILAIALTAIIKAVSQNIRATAYLQEKTIALWVGERVLNEIRTGVLSLEGNDESLHQTVVLNRDWYWQASKSPTPNMHIKKISVKIFSKNESEGQPLIHLETYLFQTNSAQLAEK